MFPLIAISAFFVLGIAFFAIGKDDFGIKRVKEVSDHDSVKGEEIVNPDPVPKKDLIEEKKEFVSAESSSEIDSGSKNSD